MHEYKTRNISVLHLGLKRLERPSRIGKRIYLGFAKDIENTFENSKEFDIEKSVASPPLIVSLSASELIMFLVGYANTICGLSARLETCLMGHYGRRKLRVLEIDATS